MTPPSTAAVVTAQDQHAQTGGQVDTVMAGFSRWLAHRRWSPGQARSCYRAVERFRAWHTRQRHHPAPTGRSTDPALARHDIEAGQRRYLAELAAAGHSHAELGLVGAALDQLCRYLDDPDAGPSAYPDTRSAPAYPGHPMVTKPPPSPPPTRERS